MLDQVQQEGMRLTVSTVGGVARTIDAERHGQRRPGRGDVMDACGRSLVLPDVP